MLLRPIKWEQDAGQLWLLVFLGTLVWALYLFKDRLRIYWAVWKLGGPPALPLLGNAQFVYDKDLMQKMSHEAYEQYGGVFRFYLTVLPYVVLLEPEDVQTVLSNPKHTDKIYFYRLLNNFLGKGLITSEVGVWRLHRKLLQPAFHLQVLHKYVGSFIALADRLADRLLRFDGREVDVTRFINDAVYEILNETILGLEVREPAAPARIEELPFRKGQVSVPYRLTHPWLLINQVYKLTRLGQAEEQQSAELARACKRMIERMRLSRSGARGPVQANSLLNYLLELQERNPGLLRDEDIIDECCTFMLAGQESVGTATAMTLFLLANHESWRERCLEELTDLLGGDLGRAPGVSELRNMRLLEMCIKEALRLYPSVPLFARTLGEDIRVGKRLIPAGCGVIIIPYSTHRLPHHFPEPHEFRPERFAPENSARRHPYAYIPFSAGPRNCIGNKFALLEMKAMISAVLRKCQIEPVPGKREVQPKFRLTVRAHGGLWIKVRRRRDTR